MDKTVQELNKELGFMKLISPDEVAEAIKMKASGELTHTNMRKLLFGLYKERLNFILRKLIK